MAVEWRPTAPRGVDGQCVTGCRISAADCRAINNRCPVWSHVCVGVA